MSSSKTHSVIGLNVVDKVFIVELFVVKVFVVELFVVVKVFVVVELFVTVEAVEGCVVGFCFWRSCT